MSKLENENDIKAFEFVVMKIVESSTNFITSFDTYPEALAHITGTIGTLRIVLVELIDMDKYPDVFNNMMDYLDKKENFLLHMANKYINI